MDLHLCLDRYCPMSGRVTSATLHPSFQRAKPLVDQSWTKIPPQAGRHGLSINHG